MLGWPNHPIGGGWPLRLAYKKKKGDGGMLGKMVKIVELQQFESLGGLSVIFETLEVKVQMSGLFRGKV
jgi:hypothetical protein